MISESKAKLHTLARQLSTVGDDCRLLILCVLIARKKAFVGEIARQVNMSMATVSHHLQVLTKEKITVRERDGKKIYYSLSKDSFVTDIKRHICKYK